MARRSKRKSRRKMYLAAFVVTGAGLLLALILLVMNGLGVFNGTTGTDVDFDIVVERSPAENLGNDLELVAVGRYSGIFLEDGSGEVVTDVLMIQLRNTGDKDLQLARFFLYYPDYTAEFEITNLPAGKTVVALEKSRHEYIDQEHLSVKLQNVAFFHNNMDVQSDTFQLTGMSSALNVKNISSSDISGDIYVYYKYISEDILYGGITFRAKISGGMKAGELKQVSTAHFEPDQCIVLWISTEG